MKRIAIAAVVLLSVASQVLADASNEIDHLLDFVRRSDVVFIRNGQEHTPAEAADHLQKKREHFRKDIKSAEDFVATSATKSIVSGELYMIRTKDGQTQECAKWLLEELKQFRNKKNAQPSVGKEH